MQPAAKLDLEHGYETASGLTEKEIEIRKSWVKEYLKDFDSRRACLRVGYSWTASERLAQMFEADSWTQRHLQEQKELQAADQFEKDKQLIIQTLRQCVVHGPYPSRISAARELAKIIGLGNEDKSAAEDEIKRETLKEFAEKIGNL